MMRVAFVLALSLTGATATARNVRSRSFLSSGMQPEVVARTLASVEEEWKAQAALFVECNATANEGDSIVNCEDAPNSFAKSCSTVVSAVVRGSGGDRDVAKEYMEDVCSQGILASWRKEGCSNLATALDKAMSADNYENRINFDGNTLCSRFWSRFLEVEKKRAAEEQAEREEQEKKAAEEAAKAAKAAQEEAEKAATKAKEEAAARAEKEKKEEEARRAAEAKAAADEAAKLLETKKAELEKKKAEAEAVAEAAKKKMEEADAAEKEHKELQAKIDMTKAQPVANSTSATVNATVNATANALPVANSSSATQQSTPADSMNATATK